MNVTIEDIRAAWLLAALAEHERVVRDDDKGEAGDREIITEYFNAVGWGFHLRGPIYIERADNPWCGIGLGYAGRRIGDYLGEVLGTQQCYGVALEPEIAKKIMPSTQRIASTRRWAQTNFDPAGMLQPTPKAHWVDQVAGRVYSAADALAPGVVATVCTRTYGDKRDEVGGHYVMVVKLAGDTVHTVEFNGRGTLGDGKRGEGVVRVRRKLSVFRRAYHFRPEHFEHMER